jgi:hypothetical protein
VSQDDRPDLPELPDRPTPWVETRPGGFFFLNAVIVAPILMVVYAVALRWLLRSVAGLDGPSRILDPIPLVAAYVAPVMGWLALPAAALVIWNLRMVDRRWARVALWVFLIAHLGMLTYTVGRLVS